VIELTGHHGLVVALAYSPDGRTLASASADGTARLWDLNEGKLIATLQSPAARAYCVAFSPDGKLLAVGYGDPAGLLQIWEVDSTRRQLSWAAHARIAFGASFNPGFSAGVYEIATGGDGDEVQLWRIHEGNVRDVYSANPATGRAPAAAVAFGPTGEYFAEISRRPAVIRVLESMNCSLHRSSRPVSDWGYSIAFHPDGRRLATGLERAVAMWEWGYHRPPYTWPAHAGAVLGVAFTPDGQTLLTGGADGLVKLWDPDSRLRHTFDFQIGDVAAVAFAPDGLTAAAGGYEKILVWDVGE
jgi:WD40 repeat protein